MGGTYGSVENARALRTWRFLRFDVEVDAFLSGRFASQTGNDELLARWLVGPVEVVWEFQEVIVG